MKKIALLFSAITIVYTAQAQVWELHLAAGGSSGKLIPLQKSTPRSPYLRYGFGMAALFVAPTVALRIDEHTRFTFGYNVSGNRVGVRFRPFGYHGAKEESFDIITLHNFSVGYSYCASIGRGNMQIGGFAKVGMAYGEMTGGGVSGSSGMPENGGYYLSTERQTLFDVVPNFWSPTSSLGFIIGPNDKNSRLSDRLTCTLAANIAWRNPYTSYSEISYSMLTATSAEEGVAQYQGMIFSIQAGVDYQLFRFKSRNSLIY